MPPTAGRWSTSVFDLLRLDGGKLEALPLEERKARLRKLVGARKTGRIRFSEHVEGSGDAFFRPGVRAPVSKASSRSAAIGRTARAGTATG